MTAVTRLLTILSAVVVVTANSHEWPKAWVEWERIDEDTRVKRHKEYFGWPPKIIPETEGWKKLSERRMHQIQYLEDGVEKYDAWIQTVTTAVTQRNFTEFGWALTRAPQELADTLKQAVHDGLETAGTEGHVDVIDGLPPIFISRPDLTARVLEELLPIHEAWSKEELHPYTAYGFRLYRNQSSLLMHVDKSNTHIISCIFHIDSSEDAEPWPILIEDFEGNTNEVILTPGDMLLYESSKCLHGRPSRFNGSWYSSIFVHYYPVSEEWTSVNHEFMGHYAVPPHWVATPEEPPKYPTLTMRGTSMREEECEHGWCVMAEGKTIKYQGPAELDYIITAGGKRYPLYEEEDEL
jgi:hypothetical protein